MIDINDYSLLDQHSETKEYKGFVPQATLGRQLFLMDKEKCSELPTEIFLK